MKNAIPHFDVSRRDVLRSAGQGLLAAGLTAAASSTAAAAAAAPPSPQGGSDKPAATPGLGATAGGSAGQGGGTGATQWTDPLAPPDRQPPQLPMPKPPGKKVGWAIVGLGELALGQVLPAFRLCEHARPVALVSGHPDKAKAVAAAYGIDERKVYGYADYERRLKDDADVDVVYVILPNSMHAEYTIRAHQAGKHVLCEKPMATTARECEAMIAAARSAGRKLMIAYRLRYEPFNQTMIELSRRQAYGPIRLIAADNVQVTKAPNIRLSKALGGGAMMDVGIYCLNAARYLTGEEPTAVSGHLWSDPADPNYREVEQNIVFNLQFPSGVLAHCSASFGCHESRNYRVFCPEGWYGLDPAFAYRGLKAHVATQKGKEELKLDEENHFAKEMDHFSECVMKNEEPRTPGEEGLRDIRLIEKIYEACREGRAVKA